MNDSIDVMLKVKKEDLYLLCPFFEAYGGMAAIRTPKPKIGPTAVLKLMVSPDFMVDFEKLLNYLGRRLIFERVV
ncbi:hypothetical protein HZB07_02980 [Candidatus Saganbacteria bacterium]|nr:hypothetical protein [Candidatus Saganbacteria bacterium]